MKFRESGSVSDTERLNSHTLSRSLSYTFDIFSTEADEEPIVENSIVYSKLQQPILNDKESFATEVTILASPVSENRANYATNIKCSDRFKYFSFFDPLLAYNSLPKILISIGGMLLTGFFLNIIITWKVFTNVPELFILIPVIFNLRGILEQGLTARLTKASRIGLMNSITGRKKIWLGNLNLVMFQSITAGLFAGLMSSLLAWITDSSKSKSDNLFIWRSILMTVVGTSTSATSSIISGLFLFLILKSFKWFKKSPDDLLGPLTNSFGGFMSLFVLAIYAGFFYLWMGSWIGIVGLVCIFIISNIYFYSKSQNSEAVVSLASEGWVSMCFSLLVTGLSGLLLQHFISEYKSFVALFLPAFTGITGTFAGIYCSEGINNLHLFQLNPTLPKKTGLTLLMLSNPFQVILVFLIGILNSNKVPTSLTFFLTFLIAGNGQILILMALADVLIKLSWKFSIKPETNVPVLMSTLSDLFGTLVLVTVFHLLNNTGNLDSFISLIKETDQLTTAAAAEISKLNVTIKESITTSALAAVSSL